MTALAPGTRIGPYEIVALLGAGGMGEVYRARDPRLGRDVALKVLPDAVAAHPERLARFEREARTVAALNHPSIVTIHSIEHDGATRFLTMELVEGQTLDQRMAAGGVPLARVLDVAIPLADALAAAHARGVVHRDLKPGNVMVTRDGRIKVLDFGLAKLDDGVDAPEPGATQAPTIGAPISAVGHVVGTIPYMAPEQLRGEAVDARADLFSFGIILFELAAGRRPFTGGSSAEVTSAILRDPPPQLAAMRTDLPRDLERIVSRCLEKDIERRFQTAKDVRNELEIVRREMGSAAPGAAAAPASAARPAAPAASAPAPAKPEDAPSVAVLPFVNRSREPDDEYFSDGLADELLNVLAKIRGLRVAARTSSATFKGKDATIAEIGRALGVATVLEGSVRKSGNRVRIAVQLVKVADGYPLWSETYDRTLDDIFAVQDDIAQSVVKELRTTLLGAAPDSKASGEVRAEVADAAKGRGGNTEAHHLYLHGRFLVDRMSEADVAKGIDYLRQAIAIDPGHALAWVQLSRAFNFQAGYAWTDLVDGYARAREAAQRAIAIEPGLAEAHAALGGVQEAFDWDWKAAEASFQRALQLAPDSAEVLAGAANMMLVLGRPGEALEYAQRAAGLDPLAVNAHLTLGRALRLAGRQEQALHAFRKVLELAPQRIVAHLWIAVALMELGRHEEALVEARLESAPWARCCAVGFTAFRAGHREESDAALRDLVQGFSDSAAYQIAAVHAARGETDEVFAWLERCFQQRDPGVTWAASDDLFRPYHRDPRWQEFRRRMGFDDPA